MTTNSRWNYKALLQPEDVDPDVNPDLDVTLEALVPDGWKLVEMDARLFAAFSNVGYKNEQFLLDVLEALADPQGTSARLVVTCADIELKTKLEPIKRPRRL